MGSSAKPGRSALNIFSQNTQILRRSEKLEELRSSFEVRNGFACCLQETGRRGASECFEWRSGFTLVMNGCPTQSPKTKIGVGTGLSRLATKCWKAANNEVHRFPLQDE